VIADLFIRGNDDLVAQMVAERSSFEGLERLQHDAQTALHVGKAGTVQTPIAQVLDALKSPLWKHSVVVAGQYDLHGR